MGGTNIRLVLFSSGSMIYRPPGMSSIEVDNVKMVIDLL